MTWGVTRIPVLGDQRRLNGGRGFALEVTSEAEGEADVWRGLARVRTWSVARRAVGDDERRLAGGRDLALEVASELGGRGERCWA